MILEHFKIKNECAICPTKIRKWDGIKLGKTPEYHEALVQLDNGSQMKIGVCHKHIKIKKADFMIIEEKMKQGWLEEVALGIGNKEWVESTGSKLHVVGA